MSRCEDYAKWADTNLQVGGDEGFDFGDDIVDIDDVSDDEATRRTEALGRAINDYLVENGYDPVDVSYDTLEDRTHAAETNKSDGNIVFDRDYILGAGRDAGYNTAYHEDWHAMQAQDGVFDRLSANENEIFNDLTSGEEYFDPEQADDMRFRYVVPEHEDADIFAEYMSDRVAQECGGGTPDQPQLGSESAPGESGLEIDWEMGEASMVGESEASEAAETADDEDDIEFTIGDATFVP